MSAPQASIHHLVPHHVRRLCCSTFTIARCCRLGLENPAPFSRARQSSYGANQNHWSAIAAPPFPKCKDLVTRRRSLSVQTLSARSSLLCAADFALCGQIGG